MLIVRDFSEMKGRSKKEALLERIVKDVMKDYPRPALKGWTSSSNTATLKQVIDS